jgi:hypothetical protein
MQPLECCNLHKKSWTGHKHPQGHKHPARCCPLAGNPAVTVLLAVALETNELEGLVSRMPWAVQSGGYSTMAVLKLRSGVLMQHAA